MSLRRRLALLSALAVALAVLLASVLVYTLVRDRLRGDIDHDLRQQAERVTQRFATAPPAVGAGIAFGPPGEVATAPAPKGKRTRVERGEQYALTLPPPEPGGPEALAQMISPSGVVVTGPGAPISIPVSSQDRGLAANGGQPRLEDAKSGDTDLRVLTCLLYTSPSPRDS